MRVLLLDADMAIDDAVEAEFSSTHSMFEFDIVVWNPLRSIGTYNTLDEYAFTPKSFEGRRWLSSHDSAEIKRDVARRKSEIVQFLELGRTLVVLGSRTRICRNNSTSGDRRCWAQRALKGQPH